MGMSIDEAERLLSNYLDGVTNYCERELTDKAIQVAIDTMRKYQKIEEIYSDYLKYMNPDNLVDRLGEILEDGNDE